MEFGEELGIKTHTPWRHLYVQYSQLSAQLDGIPRQSTGWSSDDDRPEFLNSIQQELVKVYTFVTGRLEDLSGRVELAEKSISNLKNRGQHPIGNNMAMTKDQIKDDYDNLTDTLIEILFDINDLAKYHRLNTTALENLVKRHDNLTKLDLHSKYHGTLLEKWPLDKIYFDVLIVRLSNMQDVCRLHGHPRSQQDYSQGEDQTAFERATSKYWIHPDNITEVKSIILMYLPIHVFNQGKAYEPSDSAVSSVYFDNADFDLYSERLERVEGAEAIRFRWYGESTNDIYIERKTHHASWLNGSSVKDRFRLKDEQVNQFMQGQYSTGDLVNDLRTKSKLDSDAIEQNAFIAQGVQDSIRSRQLKPMCRVFYNRTAFQLPGDQRLRLSLDHNLTFIREDHMDGQSRRLMENGQEQWRRMDVGVDYPFRQIRANDIHRFPYAVLETKIQSHLGQKTPPWLDALLNSHLVHEVPRFSKYLHGASQLYKNSVPIMPWWIIGLEKDIRKQPITNIGLSRSLSLKPLFNGHHRTSLAMDNHETPLVPSNDPQSQHEEAVPYIAIKLSDPPQDNSDMDEQTKGIQQLDQDTAKAGLERLSRFWSGKRRPLTKKKGKVAKLEEEEEEEGKRGWKKPVQQRLPISQGKKGDPKAFFANERTFISWLQFCALILTVALNLLNYGDHISRLIGATFIIFASFISIYALVRFQFRAYQMRTGRNILRMDDIYGPVVLCVLLVSALLVNFYLRAPLLTQPDIST